MVEDRRQHDDRHEDRGPEAREVESFLSKHTNRILLTFVLILTTGGGWKALAVGQGVDEVSRAHAETAAKNAETAVKVETALSSLAKGQNALDGKVDVMATQFTQILASQSELRASQAVMSRAQDDLRIVVAGLASAGTDVKLRDHDERLRKAAEDIAELKALLREKNK